MIEFSPRHEHDPRSVPQRVGEAVSRFIDTHYNPGSIAEFEVAFDRIENAMQKPENREKFHANIRPILETDARVLTGAAIVWDGFDAAQSLQRASYDWRYPRQGISELYESLYDTGERIPVTESVMRSARRGLNGFLSHEDHNVELSRDRMVRGGMVTLNAGRAIADALVTPRHQILKLGARELGFVGEKVAKRIA